MEPTFSRRDVIGHRRKEKLRNEMLERHGGNNQHLINRSVDRLDNNQLASLNENEFRNFSH